MTPDPRLAFVLADPKVDGALEILSAAILDIKDPQPRGVLKITPLNATYNLVAAILAASDRWEKEQWPKVLNVCGVCAGSGTPISGPGCICGGRGTLTAECEGLRKALYDLEHKEFA